MALPYKPRQARGQPGNHNLRVITNPCRGRCSHRPGQPRRAANAPGGYRIRPYNGFSAGRASGLPVWPVVAGRHVGEGHAPPANPALETRGLPGICGTYKMTVGRDALIPPHPAPPQAPAGGINPSPTNHGRPAANRENANPAMPQPPVGDDARIVPGTPRRRKRPGRIWNPPLQWVFRRAGIRASRVAGRCRKAGMPLPQTPRRREHPRQERALRTAGRHLF